MTGPAATPRTLLLAMLGETGHYAGTFKLARALRDRGHRVVYLGLADFEPLVRAQGFDYVQFAADLLPAGYTRAFGAAQAAAPRTLFGRFRARRAGEPTFAAYLRRIDDGSLDDALRACAPDLLVCDVFVWYVGLRAHALGIPTINLCTCLALFANVNIPPSTLPLLPRATPWGRLRVRASWRWMRLRFLFTKRLASRWLGAFRHPTRMHHLSDEFRRIARAAGYPLDEGRTWWFGEYGPRLALPELCLCPEAFQLPGAPEHDRRYAGDFVDDQRPEEPPPPLDADRPVVLCSLGTSAFAIPDAPRFLAAVVDAARARPDWQLVLHVGGRGDWAPPDAPANLLVRGQIPQLALLRRAAAMVTHGGLNSVMECVHLGVPMVIVPGLRDQPGNSARAVHHGLAVRLAMATLTGAELTAAIARVMADDGIRRALAAMKQAIVDERGIERAVPFIEQAAHAAVVASRPAGSRR